MSSCESHPKDVAGITDMKLLAEKIGDLNYETLAEFFIELEMKLWEDAKKDKANYRFKLSDELVDASDRIGDACRHIKCAWQISKKFMNNTK